MNKEDFKKWRKDIKLTQIEVALEFELTKTTIQNYEYGFSPIPKSIELSCKFLKIRKEML